MLCYVRVCEVRDRGFAKDSTEARVDYRLATTLTGPGLRRGQLVRLVSVNKVQPVLASLVYVTIMVL